MRPASYNQAVRAVPMAQACGCVDFFTKANETSLSASMESSPSKVHEPVVCKDIAEAIDLER